MVLLVLSIFAGFDFASPKCVSRRLSLDLPD